MRWVILFSFALCSFLTAAEVWVDLGAVDDVQGLENSHTAPADGGDGENEAVDCGPAGDIRDCRSNWGNELAVEHSRNVLAQGRLLSWLSLRHELALIPDYDALAPGCGVGLSYVAPWNLVPGVRVGYEHENHFRSADGRWGRQRLDNTLSITAEVSRALLWNLRLRATYQWLRNFSTISDFDYHRHLATLEVSWSI